MWGSDDDDDDDKDPKEPALLGEGQRFTLILKFLFLRYENTCKMTLICRTILK